MREKKGDEKSLLTVEEEGTRSQSKEGRGNHTFDFFKDRKVKRSSGKDSVGFHEKSDRYSLCFVFRQENFYKRRKEVCNSGDKIR